MQEGMTVESRCLSSQDRLALERRNDTSFVKTKEKTKRGEIQHTVKMKREVKEIHE